MQTTWRVTTITATEGQTRADLVRCEWYKRNPEYDALLADESYEGDLPDEFIDLDGPDHGAESLELSKESLSIDVTDGLTLRPGDNVRMVLDVFDRVTV